MDRRVELLIKEYETLRQESLDSINNRSQIVAFGLATLGLLAASLLASGKAQQSQLLLIIVFGVAIPTIAVIVLYIWLGEVQRMMRAGEFMAVLEQRINTEVDPGGVRAPVLTWEGWLRSENKQMKFPYVAVIILFLGIAAGAPFVGILASPDTSTSAWWFVVWPAVLVFYSLMNLSRRARDLG